MLVVDFSKEVVVAWSHKVHVLHQLKVKLRSSDSFVLRPEKKSSAQIDKNQERKLFAAQQFQLGKTVTNCTRIDFR